MLNPSDSIVDWVLEMVPQMGAGWCPPGMLGIGIGGTAEKAVLLAKESLMGAIDMAQLKQRGPQDKIEELRIEIRSEEHTSELQSLMRISYAVFCLKKKKHKQKKPDRIRPIRKLLKKSEINELQNKSYTTRINIQSSIVD